MNWKDIKSISIFFVFIIFNLLFTQDIQIKSFYDGPHIIYGNDSLTIKYAIDSTAHIHSVKMTEITSFDGFHSDSNQTYFIPQKFINEPEVFNKNRKIFVISDIHGQFEIFRKLLYNNNIIDSNNFWKWGNGHLVINGDVFDKGANVHECLWLIYNLEQQAKNAGGHVHFLLGNHEVKALRGDLKYVVEKYFNISNILDIPIPELYYDKTFWGRWLRSKNIITKIGNILFVHGGLHKDLVRENFSITKINQTMRENIDLSLEKIKKDTTLSFLFRKNGPIRYRGFFRPDSMPEVSNDQLYATLNYFNVERIIVGHTSHENIISTFNNRVIGVDGGISIGLEGEGLLINNDKYYRADIEGVLTSLF